MEWRGVLYALFLLLNVVESSNRSLKMWLPTVGTESESAETFSLPVFTASIFVLVALVLSMYLIFEHLSAYNQPEEQKFLIGLILMVPVYALESTFTFIMFCFPSVEFDYVFNCILTRLAENISIWFLSLLNSDAAFNCEVIRDCYEAFALYCFERYLIACLGGEERTIEFMESQTVINPSTPLLKESYTYGIVEHPFPLNWILRDWHLGPEFYNAVKIGIVQYMLLKLICALLAMILETFGVYGEGKFEWRYGYPYVAVVLNFSQTWALYCLVQFYSVSKDKLEPIKPLAKFLTFKSIVFLTWWQGVAVAFLFSIGAFRGSLARELKTRIQDYIICVEMGIAAVVHLYVFPAVPYKRGERCVRNVTVLADYASLGSPPDRDEVQDCERTTRVRIAQHDEREKCLNFPKSVRDVVLGSGEIIVDDMKYTVSHVVEPVERGIAKINKTFHQISENVKRHEERRRSSKYDSYLIPLNSCSREFSEGHDNIPDGSFSDSGATNGKRQHYPFKTSRTKADR